MNPYAHIEKLPAEQRWNEVHQVNKRLAGRWWHPVVLVGSLPIVGVLVLKIVVDFRNPA